MMVSDERLLGSVKFVATMGADGAPATGGPFHGATTVESLELLRGDDSGGRATALVVSKTGFATLKPARSLLHFRHSKNASSGLTRLFLKAKLPEGRIPVADAVYKDAGQCIRSLRRLVGNAVSRRVYRTFLLVINDEIFVQLSGRAGPEVDVVDGGDANGLPESGLSDEEMVLDRFLEDINVDEKLRARYVGSSPRAERVRKLIMVAGGTSDPVLILGEPGTGKEIAAREIHRRSARHERPFIVVNCAALPPTLIESELFGHVAGAYTDGKVRKLGLWQLADSGTLFLDEIGDLSQEGQAKILRVLEDGEFWPVGSEQPVASDVRVVAATNQDLDGMMADGRFRDDLYYRLSGLVLHTPSLSDSARDVVGIARALWQEIAGHKPIALPDAVVSALPASRWQGNVRELKSSLKRLFLLMQTTGRQVVTAAEARSIFRQNRPRKTRVPAAGPTVARPASQFSDECLSHLRAVAEVVRRCRVAARPFTVDGHMGAGTVRQVRDSFTQLLIEFDRLCADPLLFHRHGAYLATYQVKGAAMSFVSQLRTDHAQALRFWEDTLGPKLKALVEVLFAELEAVNSNTDR